MTFRSLIRFGASACALLPIAVFAQTVGKNQIQVLKKYSGIKASSISTDDFVVQIDETYNYQPIWPENPVKQIDTKGVPNKLVAGGLLPTSRGILGKFFPAIEDTGWTPPDPDLAVGANHVLAVVNSSIAWFDKNGTKLFQQSAGTFFSGMGAGSFIFDPKCFYDRINQRYVMVFLEQANASQISKLLLAVSDDNNPAGTWHRYRLESKLTVGTQNWWLDYPGFGYNKDAYVVCGNMFPFGSGNFGGVQFLVIPSAPLLSGGAATVSVLRDANGGSAQIAEMISTTAANVYGISRASDTSMRVYTVNNPSGTPTLQFTSVSVPFNTGPSMNAASTSNRSLSPVDDRVFNATWRDGRLVTSHNIQSGSFIASRWYQINTNGYPQAAPTLGQSGNVSSNQLHQFLPAISINAYEDISTMFAGSSSTVTANMLFTGRTSSDTAGAMGTPQILENSANIDYSRQRWGDYFGVDVDPVDDLHFWGIGMTVDPDNGWRTSIYKWRIAPVLKSVTFGPNPVPVGQNTTLTVSLTSPAGPGGVVVTLSPVTKGVQVPASLTIPEGSLSASAVLSTANINRITSFVVEATANGRTLSRLLTIAY